MNLWDFFIQALFYVLKYDIIYNHFIYSMLSLESSIEELKSAPRPLVKKLEKLRLKTIGDLLNHLPYRYEDFSRTAPIGDLKSSQFVSVQGMIRQIINRRSWQKKIFITEAIITDKTGGIRAIWFNQPYIGNILKVGRIFNLAGKVMTNEDGLYLAHPLYEA